MGCWNGTCGLSQLPIQAGDKVMGFLIGVRWGGASGGDQSGYCYPTDIGFPMSLPFYGKYDDYGAIDRIDEDWNTKLLMETYGSDFENFEHFIQQVERDQVFLQNEYIGKYGLGLFMILKEIADELKEAKGWWCRKYGSSHVNIKKDGEYFFKGAKAIVNRNKSLGKFFTSDLYVFTSGDYEKVGDSHNTFAMKFSGSGFAGSSIVDPWTPYRKHILALVEADKTTGSKEVKELLESVSKFQMIDDSMHALRKSWIPQSGKGSQSDEYDYYWKLTTAMRRIINRELEERKNW